MPGDFGAWVSPMDLGEVICFLGSDAAKAVHGALVPVRVELSVRAPCGLCVDCAQYFLGRVAFSHNSFSINPLIWGRSCQTIQRQLITFTGCKSFSCQLIWVT